MRTYLRILSFGGAYKTHGIFALLFFFIHNLFGVISLTLVIPFLEILFGQVDPQPPTEPLEILNTDSLKAHFYYGLSELMGDYSPQNLLIWFCLVLLTAIFLKNLFRYLSSYHIAPLEQGIINNMRKVIFGHLSILSLPYFTGKKKGRIINVVVSDVQVIQESVIGTLQNIINDPITMLVFLGAMLVISWKLTLITFIILPITGLFISSISKSLKRKSKSSQERLGELIAVMDEFIYGIRIVKAFNGEDYEVRKYERENNAYTKLQIAVRRKSSLASPVTEVLSILVVSVIIIYGGTLILSATGDTLAPADFIGFIALFSQFLAPIKTFSSAISRIQKGIASWQRVDEFLQEKPDVDERKDAGEVDGFEDVIRYENVNFRYDKEWVLRDINLDIRKGETVALVGPSGGGKSTLADLLPRFYDPAEGRIMIDGRDIRDIRSGSLRRLFGIVTQEGVLFNDSITANIAYADPNPDMERVIEAAKIANAHQFIEQMPDGYRTFIGERGTKLSGGQRQRLAIARAIYIDPPVLILDEATSALDSESEKLVQDALDKLMRSRTSLVIAHRLSTIAGADKIVVIEKGRIVETGRHEDLIGKGGVYKKLYDIQFGG